MRGLDPGTARQDSRQAPRRDIDCRISDNRCSYEQPGGANYQPPAVYSSEYRPTKSSRKNKAKRLRPAWVRLGQIIECQIGLAVHQTKKSDDVH